MPSDWSKNIVQGKTYKTENGVGQTYWHLVQSVLAKYFAHSDSIVYEEKNPEYRRYLTNVRLGQGAFRVLVTDAYSRRCAISGEKTLPVLEAAHIRPYSLFGVHSTNNGLLLRSDLHKLYDKGYITVTGNCQIEISRRIKEEFENGKDYYKYHGQSLISLPDNNFDLPDPGYLQWHNENVFRV